MKLRDFEEFRRSQSEYSDYGTQRVNEAGPQRAIEAGAQRAMVALKLYEAAQGFIPSHVTKTSDSYTG